MTVYPRCTVGIRVVGLALQHNAGFVPATTRHIAGFASAHYLCEIFLSAEQHLDIFVQASAAVEASIDDDAVALVILAQDVRIDGAEATVVH